MSCNSPVAPAARIPRATCKLFGAIKALSTIRNSVILVHGPKGCVYHINYILGMRGDRPSEIYTTGLSERDVIFGAEQKLKDAVAYLDDALRPELLFVLSCCSSDIIGEDVGSAVRDVKTRAKTIAIAAGGFEGDFHEGYSETLCQLVREFAGKPGRTDARAVNLVGMLRAGPDLMELRRILGLIGVTVNAVLTADTSRGELERLGDAALNIVPCEPSGKEAAVLLEKLCGTPYIIEEIPIGYLSTTGFLLRVAKTLGIETPALPEGPGAAPDCSFLKNRRIAIVSGPTRAVSMVRFLKEYDIAPRLIVVDSGSSVEEKIRNLAGSDSEVLIEPGYERIVEGLREHKINLLIGGMLELPLAKTLGIDHIDIMHGSERTIGFAGAENLARILKKKSGIPGETGQKDFCR